MKSINFKNFATFLLDLPTYCHYLDLHFNIVNNDHRYGSDRIFKFTHFILNIDL